MGRVKILCLVVPVLVIPRVATGASIDRHFESLRLGMTVEALLKATPSRERKDTYLNLLAGERFFQVTEAALPKGVIHLTGRFFHDQLYKISVEYDRDWFDEASWNAMVSRQMERYGKVPIERKTLGGRINEFIRWDDGTTVFILQRELRVRFKEKKLIKSFVVFETYLDKSVWKRRLEAETGLPPDF